MKKILFLVLSISFAQIVSAQLPEDAVRMSWNVPSGTARNQAIGRAMGSLGGEITSLFVNPAGLGFYKTGEFVLSPGVRMFNGKGTFRGTGSEADSYSKFGLGTTGFVWSESNPRSKWSNKSFSIAINQTANFNGRVHYEGLNNFSSFSESFAEEFANSGASFADDVYSLPVSFGTKLATWTSLIDTATTSNGVEVVGLPVRDAIINGTTADLYQERDIKTSGGITEVAFGFAANMDDKIYLGGSLGVPIVNFKRTSVITETDINDYSPNFASATYQEEYRSQGVGLNARLGLIVKPSNQFRAGLAIHTPTIYGLREKTTGSLTNDAQEYFTIGPPVARANQDSVYTNFGVEVPEFRYDLISPWKFLVSGSYLINAVEDVTQQRGFITADVEYVTHRSSRFNSANQEDDQAYYDGVNDGIKASYKGAFNFRVGGELKFNTLMGRLGFAYYGSPYKESELKARKMNVSGGIGYRNRGIFVDATYVYGLNKDVDFPYRLGDKANTFAELTNNNSHLLLTLGFKF